MKGWKNILSGIFSGAARKSDGMISVPLGAFQIAVAHVPLTQVNDNGTADCALRWNKMSKLVGEVPRHDCDDADIQKAKEIMDDIALNIAHAGRASFVRCRGENLSGLLRLSGILLQCAENYRGAERMARKNVLTLHADKTDCMDKNPWLRGEEAASRIETFHWNLQSGFSPVQPPRPKPSPGFEDGPYPRGGMRYRW